MSQLVNQGFIGQDFLWWIGQVTDDSYWRDNVLSGKYESAESIPGWGYRYKVCLLYTSPSPRDKRQSRMPSSA